MKKPVNPKWTERQAWIRKELRKWSPLTRYWTRRDLLVHIIELETDNKRLQEFMTQISSTTGAALA